MFVLKYDNRKGVKIARKEFKLGELEAKVLAERWRIEYNTFRPHSSLGYRAPAPEAKLCLALS